MPINLYERGARKEFRYHYKNNETKPWTYEEDLYLFKMWQDVTVTFLARILKRKVGTVRERIKYLEIRKTNFKNNPTDVWFILKLREEYFKGKSLTDMSYITGIPLLRLKNAMRYDRR